MVSANAEANVVDLRKMVSGRLSEPSPHETVR